jgi:hypothetical protein
VRPSAHKTELHRHFALANHFNYPFHLSQLQGDGLFGENGFADIRSYTVSFSHRYYISLAAIGFD